MTVWVDREMASYASEGPARMVPICRTIHFTSAPNLFPTSPHRVMMSMAAYEIVGLRAFILENVGEVSPSKMADFRDE
jgi:hypothetical protein